MLRMEADLEHFQTKLGKIEGSADIGKKLLEIVQAKSIAAPAPNPAENAEPEAQEDQAAAPES